MVNYVGLVDVFVLQLEQRGNFLCFPDDYEFVLATRETFQLAYKRTALVFVVLAVRNSYKDGTAFIEPVGRDYGGRFTGIFEFVDDFLDEVPGISSVLEPVDDVL